MPIDSAGGNKMFDMQNITGFLDQMAINLNQEAEAKRTTLEVTNQERQKVQESAGQFQQNAQQALQDYETIEAQGQEARRLANGNIIDRVTLIGEQILNPQAYTSAGRNKRANEIQQRLSLQGAVHNANIAVAESNVATAQSQEALASFGINTQMNALRTQVEALQLSNAAVAQTEVLRTTQLVQMDQPTIEKTLMGPSQNGKYIIGGMPYSETELRERNNDLIVRADLSLMNPIDTDPNYATKLEAQQRRLLATYKPQELEAIRANNYIDPTTGQMVLPSSWDYAYDRANKLQANDIQTAMNRQMLENQVPVMLDEQSKLIASMQPQVTPGSPLATNFAVYRAQVEAIATSASKDNSTEARVLQAAAINEANATLIKAVDEQSLQKALGDKKLAAIYKDQYLGIQTDPGIVQDFIVERYTQRKGFSEVLPQKAAGLIQKRADLNYNKMLRQSAQLEAGFGEPKKSEKEMREASVRLAFEQESGNMATSAVNQIQMGMLGRGDHPAKKAGMVKGQLELIQATAAGEAKVKVARAEGITEQQLQAIMDGRHDEANLPEARIAEIGQRINTEATYQEYLLYERQKEGLGYQVVQWYNQELPPVADAYSRNLESGERALVGDAIQTETQKLSDLWTNADEMFTGRSDSIAMEVATGAKKPENMWPILLQTSENLSDSQRQSIYYDVILPAMQQSRAMRLDDAQVMQNTLTAVNLAAAQTQDKQLKAALNTFDRQMPRVIDNFNTNWNFMMSQRGGRNNTGRPTAYLQMDQLPPEGQLRVQQVIPWLKTEQSTQFEDMLKQQSPLSGMATTGDPSKIGSGFTTGNPAAIGGQSGGNAPQPNRAIPPAQTRPSLPNQNWPFGAR